MYEDHELSQHMDAEQSSGSSLYDCAHDGFNNGLKGLLGKSLAKIGMSKSEQKKLDREQELVDLAVLILNQEGFAGLSLEKLTAKSCYSKGTIYNHFSSKEDCLSALCIRAVSSILELFKRALAFEGCSREKTVAVHYAYQLYARIEPTLFMAVLSSKAPGVREKTSRERVQIMDALEFDINHFSDAMFRNAVADGSLNIPAHLSIEILTFSNWALSFGTNALAASASEATAVNRLDPNTLLLQNIGILLDGMNWQPLSKDWDYQKTWQRVEEEIFADDLQLIKGR
jgi:AcrR family transcriptional regulator